MIDTHAHLMFEDFDGDREEVIKRAREAGLSKIVNVGCGIEYAKQALKMADGKFLYATIGLHPYDALDLSDELMKGWEALINEDQGNFDAGGVRKIVAIGETGLDYFKAKVDHEKQKLSFRKHLELAMRVGLPVIVHNREADEDCLQLLKEFGRDGSEFKKFVVDCGCDGNGVEPVRAVFHCYGSNLEFARRVWEEGFYTSFTGIVTYPNAGDLREVVLQAPLDKIMVETDCPYLAPQAYRGKRNEPAYVAEVVKCIAEIRGMEMKELIAILEENSARFFSF